MGISSADIARLVEAGVIDEATAERIRDFEAGRGAGDRGRPGLKEFATYLGVAIIGVGVTVLAATNWEDLGAAGRILAPAVPALVALVVGQVLRGSEKPELVRAGSIAWLLAAALITATAAVTGDEAGWAEEDVALIAGLVAVPVTLALWWPSPTHPQLVGIAGALFLLATAISTRTAGDSGITILGMSLTAFGLAGLVATETGLLSPRLTARLFSAAGMAIGAFYAGLPPGPAVAEIVAAAVAAVLIAASIRFGTLVYMLFGILTGFAGLVTLILRHVDDPTLAALALIGVGIAVLVVIAVIGRIQPWRSRHAGSGRGRSQPPGGAPQQLAGHSH